MARESVLSVVRNGVTRPVGFYSRQLHGAQKRYSVQELAGLAVYESVRQLLILSVRTPIPGDQESQGGVWLE